MLHCAAKDYGWTKQKCNTKRTTTNNKNKKLGMYLAKTCTFFLANFVDLYPRSVKPQDLISTSRFGEKRFPFFKKH